MERDLLSKLVVVLKRLLALKIKEDAVERVMKGVDDAAACYMPGDWIGQPQRVELSEQEYWQQVEQVLSANGNNDQRL